MDRLRIKKDEGKYVIIEDCIRAWSKFPLTEDQKSRVRNAIKEVYADYIVKEKIAEDVIPLWIIKDHSFVPSYHWYEMSVWDINNMDKQYYLKKEKEEQEQRERNKKEVENAPIFKFDYDGKLVDWIDDKGKHKGWMIESTGHLFDKFNKKFYFEMAEKYGYEFEINPKTGKEKFGKNAKKSILKLMFENYLKQPSHPNQNLRLDIVRMEMKLLGGELDADTKGTVQKLF